MIKEIKYIIKDKQQNIFVKYGLSTSWPVPVYTCCKKEALIFNNELDAKKEIVQIKKFRPRLNFKIIKIIFDN